MKKIDWTRYDYIHSWRVLLKKVNDIAFRVIVVSGILSLIADYRFGYFFIISVVYRCVYIIEDIDKTLLKKEWDCI